MQTTEKKPFEYVFWKSINNVVAWDIQLPMHIAKRFVVPLGEWVRVLLISILLDK